MAGSFRQSVHIKPFAAAGQPVTELSQKNFVLPATHAIGGEPVSRNR
ncbi:hypothetical protein ABI_38660 [Asticcacaulis biprosthecium C19]|uniref:Uncharacterized protein n=1 Tax=Asticcacaulis biprosthecium C19 TaxID=715226 RepID=F4QRT1_9CAUL|nr:hypothetical protein ABI_38660 [Asticcacaulis biprosthecium C19]